MCHKVQKNVRDPNPNQNRKLTSNLNEKREKRGGMKAAQT